MAEGEHLSEQTRHLWLADKSTPLQGTEKHPQGRLFNPGGSYTGDPMKLAPENWLGQSDTPAHDDPVAWHSSHMSSLPRSDDYEDRAWEPEDFDDSYSGGYVDPELADDDWEEPEDFSVDSQDRPMGQYGSVVGMHLGNIRAAGERSERERDFIHPARIPKESLVEPPSGGFATQQRGGRMVGGNYRSDRDIVNSQTGERTPDERWSDSAANYAETATDLVEEGKTLPYRNDVEGEGSTSFRTLPETVRTWSEDVMNTKSPQNGRPASSKFGDYGDEHALRGTPHPALVHLAEKGYDPVVMNIGTEGPSSYQMSLPFEPSSDYVDPDYNEAARTRTSEFEAGHTWQMRKPRSIG